MVNDGLRFVSNLYSRLINNDTEKNSEQLE